MGAESIACMAEDRVVMCSPFFVLDNFLANAYSCEEQVRPRSPTPLRLEMGGWVRL